MRAIENLIHYAREFTCKSEMSDTIINAAEEELKELKRELERRKREEKDRWKNVADPFI